VTNGNVRQGRSDCASSPAASDRVIKTTPHATNQQWRVARCRLFIILESPRQCLDDGVFSGCFTVYVIANRKTWRPTVPSYSSTGAASTARDGLQAPDHGFSAGFTPEASTTASRGAGSAVTRCHGETPRRPLGGGVVKADSAHGGRVPDLPPGHQRVHQHQEPSSALVHSRTVDYLTRTSFMMRPATFQSWTYRLPSLSQDEPCVPLKIPSIHSS
jgi:hypothetical protein